MASVIVFPPPCFVSFSVGSFQHPSDGRGVFRGSFLLTNLARVMTSCEAPALDLVVWGLGQMSQFSETTDCTGDITSGLGGT